MTSSTPDDDRREPHLEGAPLGHLLDAAVQRAEDRFRSSPEDITGISDLDRAIADLAAGTALVIASERPADATTLALQIAVRVASQRTRTIVGSSRLRPAALADRMLAMAARLDGRDLLRGRLDQDAWWQIGRAVGRLRASDVTILEGLDLELLSRIGGAPDESGRAALAVVDGMEPLLRSDAPAVVSQLRRLVDASPARWVFTCRTISSGTASGSADPTWRDEIGRGLADVAVRLVGRGNDTRAEVEHGHGWTVSVPLYQRPAGLGFGGRLDEPATVSEPVAP